MRETPIFDKKETQVLFKTKKENGAQFRLEEALLNLSKNLKKLSGSQAFDEGEDILVEEEDASLDISDDSYLNDYLTEEDLETFEAPKIECIEEGEAVGVYTESDEGVYFWSMFNNDYEPYETIEEEEDEVVFYGGVAFSEFDGTIIKKTKGMEMIFGVSDWEACSTVAQETAYARESARMEDIIRRVDLDQE